MTNAEQYIATKMPRYVINIRLYATNRFVGLFDIYIGQYSGWKSKWGHITPEFVLIDPEIGVTKRP